MKKILKTITKSFIKGVVFVYCKIVYRFKVIGKENIPKEGALIFCGNHRTYFDPVLIIMTAGRDMRFIAKEELTKNPLFYTLGLLYDVIFVKRNEKDITAIKESMKTLKAKGCIGIFPEGTRNGMEKNDGRVKNGAAYLALKTGAQIIPIGIQGLAKPFTKNTIIYGKPLDMNQYSHVKKIDEEIENKISNLLKDEILKLAN